MKHILSIILMVAASLTAFAAGSPEGDAKAIQGNWKPATAELAGKPMPDAVLQTISLKLDHGKYEVFVGDKPDRGTYTLDAATNPRSLSDAGTIASTPRPNSCSPEAAGFVWAASAIAR